MSSAILSSYPKELNLQRQLYRLKMRSEAFQDELWLWNHCCWHRRYDIWPFPIGLWFSCPFQSQRDGKPFILGCWRLFQDRLTVSSISHFIFFPGTGSFPKCSWFRFHSLWFWQILRKGFRGRIWRCFCSLSSWDLRRLWFFLFIWVLPHFLF